MLKITSAFVLTILLVQTAFSQTKWTSTPVAYEIFVRSFYDSNGDGIGDFNGITQKLDYLNDGNEATNTDMGIKLIWLMPMNSSPSYHGYDVTNYKKVNPQYGTLFDFQNMLAQAHNRGIKVIIDFVINHSSDQHPWFVKSAANDPFYRNFYVWNNSPSSQTGPWGQNLWYSKNGSNYYALFWSGMPDLNYNYQPVKDSIFDAAKYWIKEIGVDGFRLDAAMFLYEEGTTLQHHPKTIAFWKELNDSCESWKPNSLLIGEVWDPQDKVVLYKDKLDLCFNFALSDANMSAINTGNPFSSRVAINSAQQYFDTTQFASFLTNHDQNRVIDVFSDNVSKSKAAASLLLTQPGIPFLYYGEEVGMKGSKPDENIRRPMQWSSTTNGGFTSGSPWRALNSNYASFNVATMKTDKNSLWSHYNKLIHLRNTYKSLQLNAQVNIITTANEIHSYARKGPYGEDLIVLINTTGLAKNNVQFLYQPSVNYGSATQIMDMYSDSIFMLEPTNNSFNISLSMAPYQTRILRFGNSSEGLGEKGVLSDFKVYPNPTTNKFTLSTDYLFKKQQVIIYSLNGQQMGSQELTQMETEISCTFPSGIYLVQVIAEGYKSAYKKLVISQ